MRKRLSAVTVLVLWGLVAALPVHAQEEAEIEQSAQAIDEQASTPQGQKAVVHKLTEQFGVGEQTINDLRGQKLGYGEIATTLSLAQNMDGGLTDENIQKIADMRKGDNKTGWGVIAKQFDVKVGDLKKNVRAVKGAAVRENLESTGAREQHNVNAQKMKADAPSAFKAFQGRGNGSPGMGKSHKR